MIRDHTSIEPESSEDREHSLEDVVKALESAGLPGHVTEAVAQSLTANGATNILSELKNHSKLNAALQPSVNRANNSLSVIEQVRRFRIADQPFSVENEMLTPTMKNRRHKIVDYYQEAITSLYEK